MARFQYPSLTQPVARGGETITEDKWHQGWTEPVRQKIAPRLAVALIASGLGYVEAGPFAESVTESRWHQPWSEPVRVRPALPAGEQQALAFHPAPVVPFDWRPGLSEPVRLRPALPVGEQHVFEFDPVPFVKIDWFGALAEPVRVRAGLVARLQQDLARPPWVDINVAFAPPFSEPVRLKPGLLAALQAYEVSYGVLPLPFLGGGGGWYLPDPTKPPSSGDPSRTTLDDGSPAIRKVRKAGAPREIAPKIEPPSFAEVIGAQQPARLADVLGSAFAPQLDALRPPALDLCVSSFAKASEGKPPQISRAVIDAAADHVDAMDAMEALQALDELENQEREFLISTILAHFAGKQT
jgi:hypothetical protein